MEPLTYTPMMQQYLAVKAEVPDAFLFFRLGDFYEMFFEDAIQASRELELTLTGREGGLEERIPMCGVPYHSAENYISRLIEKGYKVAICEQMEDPATAKGMVRREIVRIVTPGTLMDGKLLNERANNYIACAVEVGDRYGFAAGDLSTGELHVTWLDSSADRLADELTAFQPAELLAHGPMLERLAALPMVASVPRTDWNKRDDEFVRGHFAAGDLDRLDPAARDAVVLLMTYLKETQKRSLAHMTEIRFYETDQFMTMDPFTRRNLELTETVREQTKKGSLYWLLDKTETAMGGRLLRRWIEKPLFSLGRIEERLEAVDKLVGRLIEREELRLVLREVYDLERLVGRISYGSASGRDLAALRRSLEQMPAFRAACLATGSETLRRLAENLDECADVLSWIQAAIVEDPPLSVKEGGIIRDGYHEHLDRLKTASREGKTWIAGLERQERERTGIKSLKVGYNKVFGYYIEITRAHLASLPEGLYERKQTLANAERYITPELKEKEALILEAEEKMFGLEYELFCELRDRIGGEIRRLQKLAEAVASVDVLQSFAAVSAANRFVRPVVTDGYNLVVEGGRHPVVEAVMGDASFIANGTRLVRDDTHVLLITGPNMAGKSTYMRQVAVLSILAQIGCFVPAERAELPLIDRIFTRIGAADDLIGGQSTFMVEMMDIRVMTEKATERSLVIIDELGRGTSTGEGMAIAQAVIEFLHDRIGCKTLVSTHFHELAHLEESLARLRNACMAVKESGQEVTFLRKLIPGAASTSYGIYCARIAGLPDSIIERSYTLLNVFETKGAEEQAAVLEAAPALADKRPAAAGREAERAEPSRTDDVSVPAESPNALGESEPAEPRADAANAPAEPPRASDASVPAEPTLPDGSAEAGAVQLSLFAEPPAEPSPSRKADAKLQQLADRLRTADLINMTPLAAMNFLYELKQKLGEADAKAGR
ncbi:DNA mismatch repair protein MutS [Gorillibacterium sp. sgz500922]|uniref:DNA mismatch repair protein MutS n=1 Tax=Gorillibacterium sp. sgz500922 TaxID=3446694 RepID=UPI003F68112B